MSSINKEGSVRQLPAGKLNNIKKLFEDGDSSNKGDKPMPPARPPAPLSRVKSPVRQAAPRQAPKLPPGPKMQLQQTASLAAEAVRLRDSGEIREAGKSDSGNMDNLDKGLETRETRKLSPTVSRRITALMDRNSSAQSESGGATENDSSPSHAPKPLQRHRRDHSTGNQGLLLENPLYGGFEERARASTDVSEMYSKVNKASKNVNGSPKKVVFNEEENVLQRRDAGRKNSGERRKTVGCVEVEKEESSGVNVAQRSKLFDAQRADKPAPPKKPESVKRHFSMRTSRELEQQQSNNQQRERIKKTSEGQDDIYDPPWDTKNSVLEELKKAHPISSALFPPSSGASSSGKVQKSPLPSKPPLPNTPPRKSDLTPLRSSKLGKTKLSNTKSDPQPKAPSGPPPKPPRTHAHDDYLKVKLDSGAEGTTVQIEEPQNRESSEEAEYLSVKDRISKMQQQKSSSSTPPLPSSNTNKNEDITMRNAPPSRPPPPKRRPTSGGNPVPPRPRPLTEYPSSQEGPVIIPVSPRGHAVIGKLVSNVHGQGQRQPNDQLPPEPGAGRSLQRFPLRKSFSSECIHSSRGSSLNGDIDDWDSQGSMTQSSIYESEYAAVIDPDGYAVPHEFMKLPGRRKHSAQNNSRDLSPNKFLTRLEGFGGHGATAQQGTHSTQEQNLDKVNKKKMLMVKQKINQAYADVNIAMRGVVDISSDNEWQFVEHDSVPDTQELVVEPTELKKRIEHCALVRRQTSRSVKKSKEYLNAIYPQLFEYCLVVGLRQLVDTNGYEPYVIHKFPENVSSNLSVPSFCFPDASIFKPGSAASVSESYSFVMTYSDATRVYGYCRRIQPHDASLPEVICIISPIDAFNMYNTLLNEIEVRRKKSSDLASELIAASFGRPLPKPGKVCHIRTLDDNGEMETIFLSRPTDNKLTNVNYESPLFYLGTDKLVKVFSSMLMERRIILCSSHLSVLTQTVHALAALLYPFQWQHVYIPLLPSEMLEVVCAPMPYIVGVLSAFLPQVLQKDLEEVFIVDLDKKSIVKSQGDESTILPRKVQRALKTAINMCKIDSEAQNAQWLMVAESFLRMFIETVGHFTNHIRTQQDGNRIFQKEGFILEVISKELRQFLEWFTETQMFEVFIVNHVDKADYGTSDLFLQRLTEYRESKEESNRSKGLGAKVKNFGKALKTKLQAT